MLTSVEPSSGGRGANLTLALSNLQGAAEAREVRVRVGTAPGLTRYEVALPTRIKVVPGSRQLITTLVTALGSRSVGAAARGPAFQASGHD